MEIKLHLGIVGPHNITLGKIKSRLSRQFFAVVLFMMISGSIRGHYSLNSEDRGIALSNTNPYTVPALETAAVVPTHTPNNTVYLSEVKFLGILNDITSSSTFSSNPSGYQDFTGLAAHASQIQGEGVNIKVTTNGPRAKVKAWIDINNDGDFIDTNEQIFSTGSTRLSSTTFGYKVPSNLAPGDYRIRIRIEDSGSGININSQDPSSYAGETEDYLLTVVARCGADIETVTKGERCGTGSVVLQASTISEGVTEFRWYTSPTGGTYSTSPNSGNSTTFNSPSIAATTTFYVVAYNGSCETQVRRAVTATVREIPNITFIPATPVACGDHTPIELTAEDSFETVFLVDENFDSTGDLDNAGTATFVRKAISTTNTDITQWKKKTSAFIPEDGADTWLPTISSGFGTNKFAFSTADINNSTKDHALELRNAINTTAFTNLRMKFRIYFSRYKADGVDPSMEYVTVEVSTNGGTTYTALATPVVYTTDLGNPGSFETKEINLDSYTNLTNLKFRIRYYANIWADGLAIDDIQIYGSKTLLASYSWSGAAISVFEDAALQIPYTEGTTINKVYIIPNLSLLEQPTFDISITTTLTNACVLNQPLSLTNYSKIWAGTGTDWNADENWKPYGVPTSANCIIIIPDTVIPPIIPADASVAGKTLTVKGGAQLNIPSGSTLTITNEVRVEPNGILEIKDTASLVQITDVDNATANNNMGEIQMHRFTQPLYRFDYTYWSSPVFEDGDGIKQSGEFSLHDLSPLTLYNKYFKWTPGSTAPLAASGWEPILNGTEAMVPGRGYIVRAPQGYPIEGSIGNPDPIVYQDGIFIGKPNNGIVRHPVSGPDKWNLLGNPYPSAISAEEFLNANSDYPSNTTNNLLGGTLYFWTHNTALTPSYNGIYSYNTGDYASYNGTGGTGTAEGTAATSGDGSFINTTEPNGSIATGQAFFVKGIANGEAIFNNSMRVTGNNDEFFR
uniref:immunoglobulin domain-containing protein n=1 Tax=Flavobacterium soli TaxID=344881 RepID=UPI00054EE60F